MRTRHIKVLCTAGLVALLGLSTALPASAAAKVAVSGERGSCGLGDGQGCCGVKGRSL